MLKAEECTLFSGGAAGTESFFGQTAQQYGVEEVNFSFDGHQMERQRGVRVWPRPNSQYSQVPSQTKRGWWRKPCSIVE